MRGQTTLTLRNDLSRSHVLSFSQKIPARSPTLSRIPCQTRTTDNVSWKRRYIHNVIHLHSFSWRSLSTSVKAALTLPNPALARAKTSLVRPMRSLREKTESSFAASAPILDRRSGEYSVRSVASVRSGQKCESV